MRKTCLATGSFPTQFWLQLTKGVCFCLRKFISTLYSLVPGSVPQNVVAVSDDNEVAVDVQWREVEETARNGRIIGYMVIV